MRIGSLFSGIEGFGLAFERAGFDLAWSVELDARCRNVIEARFPGVPIREDVAAVHAEGRCGVQRDGAGLVDGRDNGVESRGREPTEPTVDPGGAEGGLCPDCLPAVDVLTGGFPCQDLSVAGRRAGLAGARSGLWWEFHQLIGELAPRWVVIENVPGLLSSNGGRDMGTLLGSLGDLGYGWAYRVLDAQHFGLAQRRRRVFIVGCLGDRTRPAEVLLEPESGEGDPPEGREAGAEPTPGAGGGVADARLPHVGGTGGGPDDNDAQGGRLVVSAITSRYQKGPDSDATDPLVTHALTGEGHDASEDGTGRGTPIVMAPSFSKRPGQQIATRQDGLSYALTGGEPPRLTTPQTFDWQAGASGDTSFRGKSRSWIDDKPDGPTRSLTANRTLAVHESEMLVRRLTPTECEKLQGFPPGWTDVEGASDSQRYRQLGNAVAVPVVTWIARRISEADPESPA